MPSRLSQHAKMRSYLWRVIEVVSLLVFVLIVFIAFSLALRYILPFVIGWFIAFLLLPLVKILERRGASRLGAVITVVSSAVVLLVLISAYAVVAIIREATLLSMNVTEYFTQVDAWVQQELMVGQDFFGAFPKSVYSGIQDTAIHTLQSIELSLRHFAGHFLQSLTHLPETLFVIVVSVIAAFMILLNRERMYRNFLRALPPGWSDKVHGVIRDVMRAFFGTLRVQVLLMLLSATLGAFGLWIIGVPYAVIVGILFGLAGMVPIFGSALVTVPWALGAFVMGDVSLAIKILLLQAVISVIRHLIEPKILADSVGLDLLSALFGLYVGLQVMGFIGLFLGPIILIAIKSLFRARMFSDFFPGMGDQKGTQPE